MNARLLGLGTAVPEHAIDQAAAAAMAIELFPQGERRARSVATLYRRSGVRRRGSVLFGDGANGMVQEFFAPAHNGCGHGPTTAARTARHTADAPDLAAEACRRALDESGIDRTEVTHLVTVSCTGFEAPGVDVALIEALGLPARVERTHVGFMGCHGAINGLRVAAAFAAADPEARVLLCAVELCSLHFHYSADEQQVVANSLFADGAAACLVGGDAAGTTPSVVGTGSVLLPDSLDAMRWRVGDHGFEMSLSPRVPALIEQHVAPWLDDWLGRYGLDRADVGSWAVHPGGPRVLDGVTSALGLAPEALDVSRAVLAEHGNMSSPTVLFIVDRLRERAASMPCVLLAFGPGLVAEAALLR